MAHIVIIGGGVGSLPMAYQMADLARAEDRVSVVSGRESVSATSLAPWSSQPGTERGAVRLELAPALEKKGVTFVDRDARRLHPARNELELRDGTLLAYDFLVIAAGPAPAFHEIEGLGPDGFTQSICHPDHLSGCARAWAQFIADPGAIIVGAVQGASCLAPAYESAFLIDADLRRRGLRERATITFVTSEPWIGHLGLGGMGDSRSLLETELRGREIDWIIDARVGRVERGLMHVTAHDEPGSPEKRYVLPFKYALMMPPFRGIDAVSGIEGLANERGFILVDRFQRNPKYSNIYAAGVTVASANPSAAPAEMDLHKTAYIAESMAAATAHNIRDQIDGREPSHSAVWNPVCLAHLGGPGLAFIAQQEPPQRKNDWFAESAWVHMSRCSACDVGG